MGRRLPTALTSLGRPQPGAWCRGSRSSPKNHESYLCNQISSLIHSSPKVQAAKCRLRGGLDERKVVYMAGGYSALREGHPDTCRDMGEPRGHHAK